MGKPYSQDLRTRVIAAVDAGAGAYAVAPVFRVSVSYIYKALIRRRTTGVRCASTLNHCRVDGGDDRTGSPRPGTRMSNAWLLK